MKNIIPNFLSLTSRTYPYGSEKKLADYLSQYGFKKDKYGNYFMVIPYNTEDGKSNLPTTMFAAHLDTVTQTIFYRIWSRRWKLPFRYTKPVKHIFSKDKESVKTDGTTTLGADDKAGVAIILHLIEQGKAGVYYLFKGEEIGRVGSQELNKYFYENNEISHVTKCISLDRKGYNSLVTHMRTERTCSDLFAATLCKKLNKFGFWFFPDPHGVSTDSKSLSKTIPECTNISCGYFNAHKNTETQDLTYLVELANAIANIDFESLPVERNQDEKPKFAFEDFKYSNLKKLMLDE
jgi:hypothetical protein